MLREKNSLMAKQPKSCCKESSAQTKIWWKTWISNVDHDNCSSNSLYFYFLLFIVGSLELFFSVCLVAGWQIIPNAKKSTPPYVINTSIFALGMSLELVYWIICKIVLARRYVKTYGRGKTCCYKTSTIAGQSFVSILPCDMLLFFGYDGTGSFE